MDATELADLLHEAGITTPEQHERLSDLIRERHAAEADAWQQLADRDLPTR